MKVLPVLITDMRVRHARIDFRISSGYLLQYFKMHVSFRHSPATLRLLGPFRLHWLMLFDDDWWPRKPEVAILMPCSNTLSKCGFKTLRMMFKSWSFSWLLLVSRFNYSFSGMYLCIVQAMDKSFAGMRRYATFSVNRNDQNCLSPSSQGSLSRFPTLFRLIQLGIIHYIPGKSSGGSTGKWGTTREPKNVAIAIRVLQ